ncbi:extracelular serine carboxypeptidase-like protein [Mycena olivaceomarginata]|nr:extracelular serine carboxypeptidase-like protein [Mycena olivaceomarginata]
MSGEPCSRSDQKTGSHTKYLQGMRIPPTLVLLALVGLVFGHDLSRLSRQVPAPPSNQFNQLTNHFPNDPFYGPPPANATFLQNYIVNDTFYKAGDPSSFSTVAKPAHGVVSLPPYRIVAELAQATGGMGIIIEHRYYGTSFPELGLIPSEGLSTDNLRWLTTDQSIADIAYFAQHVTIPDGGSLAGAEGAFVLREYGDVIYGGISSSGTVQAFKGYPQWYYTIQENAPRDCVRSIEDIVDKMDFLINTKNTVAQTELKTILNPFFYPTSTWQELIGIQMPARTTFSTNSTFSAVDSQLSKYTGGVIWKNLGNYANYIKTNIVPLCPPGVDLDSNECFGTHNATAFANPFDLSGNRAYLYQSCLESGQWSQGAPLGRRTLLSRSIQTDYTQRWCQWSFPDGQFNKIRHRQCWQVDGGIDPWQYACVHSPDGFKRTNTLLLRPYYEIKEGGHHWDENGLLNITAEPDIHGNS